jgi:hypothetical protein
MRKLLRFAALVAVIAVTSWLSTGTKAQAYLDCDAINGKPCSTPCQYTDCYWTIAQEQIVCLCDCSSHTWTCYF